MIVFLAVFFFIDFLVPLQANAVEKGYDEALEYFIYRDENKKKEIKSASYKTAKGTDSLDNIILSSLKYFASIGSGKIFGYQHYSAEIGIIFLQNKYFQQNLYLEYIYFNTKNSENYRLEILANAYGEGLFLVQNTQLSSQLFYLGPEVSIGVGRIFDNPRKGNLLMLKMGLVYSNKWSRRMLFSAHLYYRRSQYFKKGSHDDGLGVSLRFGF